MDGDCNKHRFLGAAYYPEIKIPQTIYLLIIENIFHPDYDERSTPGVLPPMHEQRI